MNDEEMGAVATKLGEVAVALIAVVHALKKQPGFDVSAFDKEISALIERDRADFGLSAILLSHMLDLREEEELANTKWFYIIQDFLVTKEEDSDQSRVRKVDYYKKLRKYVKANILLNNVNDDLKHESSKYELWNDILYNMKFKTSIIVALNDLVITIEVIYKNLDHYEKWMTLNIIW